MHFFVLRNDILHISVNLISAPGTVSVFPDWQNAFSCYAYSLVPKLRHKNTSEPFYKLVSLLYHTMKDHKMYENHYYILNSTGESLKWKKSHLSILKNEMQNDFLTSLPCRVREKLLKINSNVWYITFLQQWRLGFVLKK